MCVFIELISKFPGDLRFISDSILQRKVGMLLITVLFLVLNQVKTRRLVDR